MAAKKVTRRKPRRKPRLTRKKREEKGFWDDAPIISMYTRQQAIEDGVLVDVSELAKEEYGINLPLAFTRAVWDEYITPDPRSVSWGQSIRGRLHDTLHILLPYLKHVTRDQKWIDKFNRDGSVTFYYKLWFVLKEKQRREIQLKVVISLDEKYRPVVTIMKTGED